MNRGVGTVQKPENVLKRVNELIKSGNNSDKSKTLALEQLHNMFTQKKRAFQKVFESIMKRHLELCVDLKDFRTAKDGLHQYRTMTQLVDPQSLEAVSMHLIELAETRASEARMKADKVALAAAAKISDLDQEETPETIMLLSMTYEGAKDRTNREVVVPWLKFLWETYRTILELLYKNNRLERVYHKTCEKAFKFCQDYQRHNEFRRLCEMLRSHFANLQRATQMNLRANKPAWEWTSEGVELHLQTRFSQLEVSSSLELWNEGFRTVEDIYDIMQLNKKTPKPKLMVTYYEKLTRIFWVSENYLFHAYAWFRFYCLCLECKKDMKPEERSLQASCVLLAAMCIPNFRETEGPAAVLEDDEVAAEKNAQMALLLDFQANPTRQALLGEIVSRGVLNEVPPELSALYHSLETGFRPLNLVKDMAPMLAYVKGDAGLCMYSIPLQKVATLRTVMHLSRVFSTLRLSSLKDLVANLDLSYCDIEKLLVDSASNKQIQLRIDHGASCIRFGTSVAATSAIETQAATLGAQLNRVTETISLIVNGTTQSLKEADARREYLEKVSESLDEMYASQIERRSLIERRKEGLERVQLEKQKEEQRVKEAEEARRREEESHRLRKEEEARKLSKDKKLKDQLDVAKTKKALESLGKLVDENVLNEMDETSRRALVKEAQSDALRAKDDEARRITEQQKKLDYVTRALRMEAADVIANRYKADVEIDRKEFESRQAKSQVKMREDHQVALVEKARLMRVLPVRSLFEGGIVAMQKAAFDAKVSAEYEDALLEHRLRKVARARQLREDDLDRQEEEAAAEKETLEKEVKQRAAEEEKERKRLEKFALEEEKRTRDADLERRRQENIANIARQKKVLEDAEIARRTATEDASWSRTKQPLPERSREPAAAASTGETWGRRGGDVRSSDSRPADKPAEGGGFARGGPVSPKPAAEGDPKPLSGLDRLAALGAADKRDEAGSGRNSKWGGGSRGSGGGGGNTDEGRWR